MRKIAAAVAVLVLGSTTLSAQYSRRYEVGLFGGFTKYDDAFQLGNKSGGGVRFAYSFTPLIAVEVEGLFQSPQDVSSVHVEPLIGSASLVFNALNKSRMSAYLLGGYTRLDFGNTAPYDFTDGGFHGAAGAKFYLSSRVALRIEGRGIYTAETKSTFSTGSQSATHMVGTAGLSFFQAGGQPTVDSDRDHVEDKSDACPDTPQGASVDKRGCPSDQDLDTVLNGLDKCPGTPSGATVDATGCPHDQDGDRVWDGIDRCPDTPSGVTVDAAGCPPAPGDSDADGVNDLLDKCPATPSGAMVDATGCPIDSDRDAVWDGLDKCPDTPIGAVVDPNGCPKDSDGDRVFDGIDRCPDTASGTPVDAYGCPADSDRDGVGDGFDKCPNTPAGTVVDVNGCPPAKDTDGDGVIDPQDRCPNTPAGSQVDQFGCIVLFAPPPPGIPPVARPTVVLKGVNFQSGRSVLTASSYAVLDQVAASLIANPEIRIEVAGYTDSTGARMMNLQLSMARAGAVRAYLARRGVSPMRMSARGYGASGYIAPNATPEGRATNRRTELHKLN